MSTIGKALSLLDTVSRLDREAGLTDIARRCALDKATARRFLVELERHGFVEQDPETRKYRIGSAPVRLARIREARYPFLRVAVPFIKALAESTTETVHLSNIPAAVFRPSMSRIRRAHTASMSMSGPCCLSMRRPPGLPILPSAPRLRSTRCCQSRLKDSPIIRSPTRRRCAAFSMKPRRAAFP